MMKEIYDAIHSKKKYVFSTTQSGDDTGAIFISSNVKEKCRRSCNNPVRMYGCMVAGN